MDVSDPVCVTQVFGKFSKNERFVARAYGQEWPNAFMERDHHGPSFMGSPSGPRGRMVRERMPWQHSKHPGSAGLGDDFLFGLECDVLLPGFVELLQESRPLPRTIVDGV